MDLNEKLRWKLDSYVPSQQNDSAQIKHALIHIMKAGGLAAEIIEPLDHASRSPATSGGERIRKYLADLVICAVRIANLTGVDLEAAVKERLTQKMDP